MSLSETASAPDSRSPSAAGRLFGRKLAHYPDTRARWFYLAVVTLVTVVQYYDLYVIPATSTDAMAHYNMTFTFFVYIGVAGGVAGAFASLVAGLADRWGRANLVVGGMFVVGVLVAFFMPYAPNKETYLIEFALVSVAEGIVLVATPALTRDFSPQLGRASAMGFWTMGPALGSVVVTVVASHTLGGSTTFQDEIRWAGYAGLAVFVVALFTLRELSPGLRDQLMVSLRDRALVEARAAGLDTETLQSGHWRQMLRVPIIGSAFAISSYLMVYYAAVAFFVAYFATTFGYTVARSNAVATWYWAAFAVSLVVAGMLSDLLKVRKPFMVVGALGSIAVISVFATKATDASTSYSTMAWLCAGIGTFTGITYAPWMASFTETVERTNPAATATGLAVWGWILRIVLAGSSVVLPLIVTSATPLVDHGPAVQAAFGRSGQAALIAEAHPQLFQQLSQYSDPRKIPPPLLNQALNTVSLNDLLTVQLASRQPTFKGDIALLQQYGTEVQNAQKTNPAEWKRWWFVCVGGQVVFLPFIFLMAGRWSPKKAAQDAAEHRRKVEAELAALEGSALVGGS